MGCPKIEILDNFYNPVFRVQRPYKIVKFSKVDAYSFNNPLRYIDYDGQIPYPITIRSFAPTPTFGGGFHGDNRNFSTNSNASARVTQNIAYDTERNYLKTSTWSDAS